MPAHNSHIHTRTHAPRAGTHTRGTPSLPSLSHNRQQLLGSREQPLPTMGSPVSFSEAELRPSPLAALRPAEGRAAPESGRFGLSASHAGKRCLPPPSTRASERNKRPPKPPSSGPPSPDPAWGLPLQQMNCCLPPPPGH